MMTEYGQHHGHQDYQRGYEQHDQRGYQQYDQQPPQQQQQQRPNVLERGRAVRLMRNGDPFFSGRTFVINQKKYPLFEVFLDDASQSLRANFGAVRCIYTPKHGTRLRDITELEDHRTYVAAGKEKFKKLQYLDIAEGKRVASKGQIPPKVHLPPVRRMDVEGRALKLSRSENTIIYVYRNGDPLTLPAKILLVKPTLQNWESVLDEITRKISLSNTAVLKLYAMNGELITSGQQLEYNGMYVAAGKERFRRIDYPDPKSFSASSSPKLSRKSSKHQFIGVRPPMKLPPLHKRTDDSNMDHTHHPGSSEMQQRYIKNDGTYTHTTATNSHGSTEHSGQRRPIREEYDFFSNRPQQHRRGPVKETDLDRDDGGIYKGRLNYRERVHEIDDTRDTKVDLPVDRREVETVEEENLYGNIAKIPRRHHQPPNQLSPDARQKPSKSPAKIYTDDDNLYYPNNNNHQPPNQLSPDARQKPSKSPAKIYTDDDNLYYPNNNNHHDNSSDLRTPTQIDDDQQSPQLTRRQSFITTTTQANTHNKDQAATVIQSHVRGYLTRKQSHPKQQSDHVHQEKSYGIQYYQPSQLTERNYHHDNGDI